MHLSTETIGNRTFRSIFSFDIQFEIPFFQRGYAWERRQWDQLLEDINDHIIPDLDAGDPASEIEHFFGPIVVLEKKGNNDGIKRFLVIDGQQRITTVYLLLGIIYRRLEPLQTKSSDATKYRLEIGKWLINETSSDDDYQKLKLFSIKGDRLPTYRAIFGTEHTPRSPHYRTDIELYQPGANQVDAFVAYAERKMRLGFQDVAKLWQLATAIFDCLKIVWIPLEDGKDDPQAIFESLNDKGMPLSASELICSYLFRPLTEVSDFEELHNHLWLAALREFRHRSTFEEYLRNLFSIGERKMVGTSRKVYVHFKNRHKDLDAVVAREKLQEIHDSAKLYGCIVEPEEHIYPDKDIRRILEHIANTRMESSTPFLLDLIRNLNQEAISKDLAVRLLNQTLTMLVRRKMTEQPTTVYDTMFPRLFMQVAHEADPVKALHQLFQKNEVWVSDLEFLEAFLNKALYRTRDLAFGRMVLSEIDRGMQKHDQYPDYSSLRTIEHVIPQTLDSSWAAYLGPEVKHPKFETLVNSIGNLCLTSLPANSVVGRASFASKVKSYSEITALARDLKDHEGLWNVDAVRERSERLAKVAVRVWSWQI